MAKKNTTAAEKEVADEVGAAGETKEEKEPAKEIATSDAEDITEAPETTREGNDQDSAKGADEKPDEGQYGKYVYIGPSITSTKLREGLIMRGTRGSVEAYLSDEIEAFPEVEKLVIPIDQLAKSRTLVKQPGNRLNKYYEAVQKAARD